ncbi:MAG: hypothetical protein H7346_27610 [Burkholderiaceae bacterium]|nr:hypothetical protein [Burkholderiaceae bacterium]
MLPINPLDRALGALRKTLGGRAGSGPGPTGRPGAAPQPAGSKAQGGAVAKLQVRVRQAVAHVDLTTEAGQQQAVRVFLETALSEEFGADVLNDPAFADLVESVKDTMMGDRGTRQILLAMLSGMPPGPPPAGPARK